MQKIYLVLVLCVFASCQFFGDGKKAQDFQKLSADFGELNIASSQLVSCDEWKFGPNEQPDSSISKLSTELIEAAIPESLLRDAAFIRNHPEKGWTFDSDASYYSLGKVTVDEDYDGYVIGAYRDERKYSSQMFVYNKTKKDFAFVQTLNYHIGGGSFDSNRAAWLSDRNGDSKPDIVYFLQESFQDNESDESYQFKDSVHIEIWNGNSFEDAPVDDIYALRAELGIESEDLPAEDFESDDSDW